MPSIFCKQKSPITNDAKPMLCKELTVKHANYVVYSLKAGETSMNILLFLSTKYIAFLYY